MVPGDQTARLHRERDRRLWRQMGVTLFLSACLVGLVLGIVGLRVTQVRFSYRLDQLRAARTDLEDVNRRLKVEVATLRSLARIESRARGELGMLPPSPGQVRLAREYLPGGTGTTPLRTAWEEQLAPAGP